MQHFAILSPLGVAICVNHGRRLRSPRSPSEVVSVGRDKQKAIRRNPNGFLYD